MSKTIPGLSGSKYSMGMSEYPFGGGPPTVTTTSNWMPEQAALSQEFANYLRWGTGGGQWTQPTTGYTGEMTAGWQPEQERALSQYQEAYTPLSAIAAGPSSPEYQKQMDIMAAPLRRTLTEQTLPAMREQYGAQGLGLSTPLTQQEMQARVGTEENIASAMQQRQMGALQQMPQVTQAYAAQAGAKQTAEQTALTNKYNEWLRTRPEYSPWLQTLMTYLGQQPKETIVTTR